jgi:hypothetical protein
MPRDDAIAVVKITARGLRKQEKLTDIDQKYVRKVIQEMIEEIGIVSAEILQDNAPVRTGRLRDSVHISGRNRSVFRPEIRIGIDVRSDESFPYLDVTRFGRRAVVANPIRVNFRPEAGIGGTRRPRKFAPEEGEPGFQRRPRRAHMLRFEPGPPGTGFIYRRAVRAYRPGRDWVRASDTEIQDVADFGFRKVTREVEKVLNSDSAGRRATVKIRTRTGTFR